MLFLIICLSSIEVQEVSKMLVIDNLMYSYEVDFLSLLKRRNKISKEKASLFIENFELIEGDRYAIIGLNGSGKSTFLKIVSGILQAQSGTIFLKNYHQRIIEKNMSKILESYGETDVHYGGNQHQKKISIFLKKYTIKMCHYIIRKLNIT